MTIRKPSVPILETRGSQVGMNKDSPQLTLELVSGPADDAIETNRRILIDVPTLAQELGVTPRFIRRLIAERRVPFLKIGKFIRFDPLEIDRWVDVCRVPRA